jgi:hypothetical protein
VLVEEEVGGLDVAVHQPAHVRVVERGGHLPADVRGLRGRQPVVTVEHAAQAAAFEQLEDHERQLVLAPVVDGHDVRMVQRGRELSLGPKPPEETGVVGERGMEDLDRHAAAEADVVGDVHPATRARADRRPQAVSPREHPADEIAHAARSHGRPPYRPH